MEKQKKDEVNLAGANQSAPLSPAVREEISTTKNENQKTELADELFPPSQRKKRMAARRILH